MPPDGSFQRIVALASKIFNLPIALITLVDQDRIWFKANHGTTDEEMGERLMVIQKEPGYKTCVTEKEGAVMSMDGGCQGYYFEQNGG